MIILTEQQGSHRETFFFLMQDKMERVAGFKLKYYGSL